MARPLVTGRGRPSEGSRDEQRRQ